MSKDISKILTKGTARQRIVLLSTDSMQEYLEKTGIKPEAKPLLTEEERKNLFVSFKTPQEVRYYNKYAKINRDFPYALMVLRETQLQYNEAIAYLIGFTNTWQDYQFTVQTFNRILYEIKEKKLKEKLKKNILNDSPFIYANLEGDEDGFLRLVTNSDKKRPRLEGLIKAWSNKATTFLIQAKSYIKATRDYLIEEDFLIQSFKDVLNHYEKFFQEDRALIEKYSKRQMSKLSNKEFFMLGFADRIAPPEKTIVYPDPLSKEGREKFTKHLEKYFVFPDYDEVEVNEDNYNSMLEGIKKR